MTHNRALSVAVLIELERGHQAGGHVKCWERFAEAAVDVPDLDLTLYVLGEGDVEVVARNVRFVSLRPVVSTRPVLGLIGGVDASDLAPYHRGLARRLVGHDVWHITHDLAFAATAVRLAARHRRPLTASVHTDVPALTRVYVGQVIDRARWTGPFSAARGRLEEAAAGQASRRRQRLLAACDQVLVSSPADEEEMARTLPRHRIGRLRRGIDTRLFTPHRGDRERLLDRYSLPRDRRLVLFAGRVDATKGVLLAAEAVRRLRHRGRPVHLVLAGRGADAARVGALLGTDCTLLGSVPQAELARLAASCDLFAFPSRTETVGNVVVEAMAAGLPVILPAGARTAQWLARPGVDGLLVNEDTAAAWANALDLLLGDPDRRRSMGAQARQTVETHHPSWSRVLREDLLPVWRRAGAHTLPREPALVG